MGVPCRSCGSAEVEMFHRVCGVPVANAALSDTAAEAAEVPTGDMELAACGVCGFIQNAAFDESLVSYGDGYEDTQAHSERFVRFASQLSSDLIDRHGLHGGRALEIGCGKGDFLRIFCEASGGTGVGYDPAVGPGALAGGGPDVELFDEPFTSQTRVDADVVVCRHTLEHVSNVRQFVTMVADAVADSDPLVFFEVPDAGRILAEGAFWDLYYEHCSYFTRFSLIGLFESSGLVVERCTYGYDGQYLLIEARVAASHRPIVEPRSGLDAPTHPVAEARNFAQRVEQSCNGWRERIFTGEAKGETMVLWGGGSKSVGFMAETRTTRAIDAVVDINPRKHGRFLPGSAQQIVAPAELKHIEPDLIVVMNPVYVEEVAEAVAGLGVSAEVLAL